MCHRVIRAEPDRTGPADVDVAALALQAEDLVVGDLVDALAGDAASGLPAGPRRERGVEARLHELGCHRAQGLRLRTGGGQQQCERGRRAGGGDPGSAARAAGEGTVCGLLFSAGWTLDGTRLTFQELRSETGPQRVVDAT